MNCMDWNNTPDIIANRTPKETFIDSIHSKIEIVKLIKDNNCNMGLYFG